MEIHLFPINLTTPGSEQRKKQQIPWTADWWQGTPSVSGCVQAQHQSPLCHYMSRSFKDNLSNYREGRRGGENLCSHPKPPGTGLHSYPCPSHPPHLPHGTPSSAFQQLFLKTPEKTIQKPQKQSGESEYVTTQMAKRAVCLSGRLLGAQSPR